MGLRVQGAEGTYWDSGKENGNYCFGLCRPMINEPPPFKGLYTRTPIIVPILGKVFKFRGLHYIGKPGCTGAMWKCENRAVGGCCIL